MRKERGIAMVMLALLLVFLLIMAAFVVDLGAAYVERRDDQNAADTGALAGGVELAFVVGGSDAQDIVDEVMAAVEGTVGSISNAEWATASNCPGEPPSGFTAIGSIGLGSVTPNTNCISVDNAFDTIRVRVPLRTVNTAFATVIGIDQIDITAVAEASIELPTPVLTPPFVVPQGARAGDDVCLRSSGGPEAKDETSTEDLSSMWGSLPPLPYDTDNDGDVSAADPQQIDPCDQRASALSSGQFGTLLPHSYVRTPCAQDNAILEVAIAEGVDHPLSRYPAPFDWTDTREDGALCNGTVGPPFPNAMRVDTGFASASLLTCGLMGDARSGCNGNGPTYDGDTIPGRLVQGSFSNGTYETEYGRRVIDGIAPWYFLLSTNSGTCDRDAYTSSSTYVQNWTRFQNCLVTWTSGAGTIFDNSIVTTTRFSFIPFIAESAVGVAPNCGSTLGVVRTGGTCVHFVEFAPVFFHRLYGTASGGGSPQPCDVIGGNGRRPLIQLAGDGGGFTTQDCGRSGLLVHRMAGVVLDCGMLSNDICIDRPGETPGPGGDIVFDIRLTD
jgi:hypothetical protein